MADTFTLGGHEFTSRFILGSGKYSLDLIKAAVEYAGAQIVTLALRRATLGSIDNHSGLHSGRRHPSAEHLRCPQCRRSCPHCSSCSRSRLLQFY